MLYTFSHTNFAKIHCSKKTPNNALLHDTLSHNFLINCNTLSYNFLINCNTLSHNFYQKRTSCCIIIIVKGHPFERHIPSSQIWEYPLRAPTLLNRTFCRTTCWKDFLSLDISQGLLRADTETTQRLLFLFINIGTLYT